MCTVRILCLAKMTFVEETLGESVVRSTSAAISVLIGTSVSFFLLFKGEITLGTLLTYTVDNPIHVGELKISFFLFDTFENFFSSIFKKYFILFYANSLNVLYLI